MSSISVTSSKKLEKQPSESELLQELEAIRAFNKTCSGLLAYLTGLRRGLGTMHENYVNLGKVNEQWVDMVSGKLG